MKPEKNIEELVRKYRVTSSKRKDDIWAELESRLDSIPGEKTFRINWWKRIAVAAAVLLAALVFSVLADSFLFVERYATAPGEQKLIWLPDSTAVTLNPNSKLRVNYSFINGRRKLHLTGEALFNVKKGKKFSVNFEGGKVEVLGTQFTVEAYKNITPEINCLAGSVKVKSGKSEAVLQPGKGVKIEEKSKLKPEPVKEPEVLAEINGEFSWENKSLGEVFKILEARSGYKVQASDQIMNRRFTGKINLNRLKSACDVLAFAMELDCKIDEQNKTVIFEASK